MSIIELRRLEDAFCEDCAEFFEALGDPLTANETVMDASKSYVRECIIDGEATMLVAQCSNCGKPSEPDR